MLYGEQRLTPEDTNDDGALHWYYLHDVTGATQYGWKYLDASAKWVHYDAVMGWMHYGEHFLPCNNSEGASEHWYYFDQETGAAHYGWAWIESGNKAVFYDEVSAWMVYGRLDYQGKRYHLDEIDRRFDAIFGNNIIIDRYVNWILALLRTICAVAISCFVGMSLATTIVRR